VTSGVTVERVKQAWALLVGVPALRARQVVVRADSYLCPPGWIGILALADTITVSVPRDELLDEVDAALGDLPAAELLSPTVVLPRLPPISKVLGPAALFYPTAGAPALSAGVVEEATIDQVVALLGAVDSDELDESGIAKVTEPLFVIRSTAGEPIAACGYRRWPNGVAHLSVLTHPEHRRVGHGATVAAVAIQRAANEGLLPQWRARPSPSKALARKLGLVELGAQLSLRPSAVTGQSSR
jgi:GNAT superfamily N-acetyltransferase